jgi:hypothetical protein
MHMNVQGDWFSLYQAALLETDRQRSKERLRLAKQAVRQMLAEPLEHPRILELQLNDALRNLNVIEKTEFTD